MRIGELSRRSGIPRDTIRFWERRGLLSSGDSSEPTNDYRDYPEETVERLLRIVEARAAGFSVADLERLFGHLEAIEEDPDGAERFLDEKIEELRETIARSKRLLTMLRETKRALASPSRRRTAARHPSRPGAASPRATKKGAST